MKISTAAAMIALVSAGAANAQTYATYDQPGSVTTSISTPERVQRVYSVSPQPATSSEIEQVYSAPAYEPYQPTAFDSGAYQTATEPLPPTPTAAAVVPVAPTVSASPDGGGRPYGQPVDVTPGDDLSQPLGSPQTFAAATPAPIDGDLGFQTESETSRLLLALEETYAKRVSGLKAQHLTDRKALLDEFERESRDPEKVLGLAERMRKAMGELDAAHDAKLKLEESQYTAATLKVLDAAPSRVQ